MFTETLPAEVFATQREFIKIMGGKLDFEWVAKTLVVEETKELEEAYKAPEISTTNVEHIFKELADVIYVVAQFYNVLPPFAPELISQERNEDIQRIMDEAAILVSEVSQSMKIPLPLVIAAFEEVHRSNMSKLDDNGQPILREDGKILKGPNYAPADMSKVVAEWQSIQHQLETNNAQIH